MAQFPLYVVEGIILKRNNVGEADRVVTIFSKENGKIYAVAKGIRKIKSRRAPHLEVFTRDRIVLHRGKKWDIITEVQPIHAYSTIRKHLPRIGGAYYIVEIIEKLLPEKQEHRDIFLLLVDVMNQLDAPEVDVQEVCDSFSITLLEQLGYLTRDRRIDKRQIIGYIESILEKRLKTPKLLARFSQEEET